MISVPAEIQGCGQPYEGPSRGGFCLFCASNSENSFNPNLNSFDDSQNFSDYSLQPQYKTYPCKLSGNDSHYGYDCSPRFPFVYEQEPCYNRNFNENYYPHNSSSFLCCDNADLAIQQEKEEQADDEEMLQDKEKFMKDTQTFLEKFNRYSFGFTLRVLSIAWERISKIKYVFTEPKEIPELMCKLREDVRNIREELAEYINSPSWNRHTFFFHDDEEYSIQYKEYLEKFPDAVTIVLPTEEPEYSLSMGYEHLSTTLETESDEVTESSAKNLLPIPSECESLSPSPIPVEDSDSLMVEIDLFFATNVLLPPGIESDGYDSEGDIHFLEELLVDDSIPILENESSDFDHDDPLFPRPLSELPDVEIFFDLEPNSGEVISTVMNNIDELNEDECFDPGGEIDVLENVKDDDYFPFIFVIRIFLPYLIYPDVSPLLLSIGS
nr:hypothetical protein [Tanacetum cinerariifolium]